MAKAQNNTQQTAATPRTPDPMLPLFDDREPISFSHQRQPGRVFSQLAYAGAKTCHPSHFYIEWQGSYHPISGLRLIGILGSHSSSVKSLSRTDMARILGSIQITYPLASLLHAAKV